MTLEGINVSKSLFGLVEAPACPHLYGDEHVVVGVSAVVSTTASRPSLPTGSGPYRAFPRSTDFRVGAALPMISGDPPAIHGRDGGPGTPDADAAR
jgi:hypothetical protein